MRVKKVSSFDISIYKITEKDKSMLLSEGDAFEHYRNEGYNVYSDYSFYFRRGKKTAKGKWRYPVYTTVNKVKLLEKKPEFSEEVFNLFRRYKNGGPDLLIEKDGIYEFVEVKTTSDSLRPNQLIFLEALSQLHKTSLHYFIDASNPDLISNLKRSRKKARKDKAVKEKIKSPINEKVKKQFLDDLIKLTSTQKRKGYKKYWIISKIYALYPEKTLNPASLELIQEYTGIKIDRIQWFLKMNGLAIIQDSLDKLVRKEKCGGKITSLDLKLEAEYTKILTYKNNATVFKGPK